jgi:hypothetical protein
MSRQDDVALDFIYWLDRSSMMAPFITLPHVRCAREIAAEAMKRGIHHGRITLWLWKAKGTKMALAMARIKGDGGERPVQVIRGIPPFMDDDKAEIVTKGERA